MALTSRQLPWEKVLFAIIGFTATLSQILLIRELVVVFYGNELSLGLILGGWLFWTAIGSGVLGWILRSDEGTPRAFGIVQIILGFLILGTIFLIRIARVILHRTPGEILGLVPMFGISFVLLAPFCMASGLLFTLGCRLFFRREGHLAGAIGTVYFFEAIGASIGGFLISFLLLRLLPPFHIAFLLSGVNWISGTLLLLPGRSPKMRASKIIPVVVVSGGLVVALSPILEEKSLRQYWGAYPLVHSTYSVYGHIAVTRLDDQVNFYENGLLMGTAPNLLAAEESVHFALLEHPHPERVLLIGGGIAGSLRQILMHPSVQQVDYVELDPKLVKAARDFLRDVEAQALRDPRVRIWTMDGRLFLRMAATRYDVIILNLPNPFTAQLNRFYTLEFFQEVSRKLTSEGVFSLALTSSENVIGDELAGFLSCIYLTLRKIFPAVILIPGDTNYMIAGLGPRYLTDEPQELIRRLKARNLQTLYFREYYLLFRLTPERKQYLHQRIAEGSREVFNRDFRPIGYYYDIVLWSSYYYQSFRSFFQRISTLRPYLLLGVILGVVLLAFLGISLSGIHPSSRLKGGLIYSLMVVGFTEIALEFLLILGFQVIYGYAYYLLALIITCYMVGLSLGSGLTTRRLKTLRTPFRWFMLLQVAMTILPLALLGLLYLLNRFPTFAGFQWLVQIIFPVAALVAGLIGGLQFPLANLLYFSERSGEVSGMGVLYAVDLVGSCLGAFLPSAFWVPIWGIHTTSLLLMFMNLSAVIVLLLVGLSPFNREKSFLPGVS